MELIGAFNDIYFNVGIAFSILLIAYLVSSHSNERNVIMTALAVKLFSSVAYSYLIVYYFSRTGGADAWRYHVFGSIYSGLMRYSLSIGSFDFLWINPFFLPSGTSTSRTESLSGFVHFFVADSFLASSFVFSVIGFVGQWLIYRTFVDQYPDPHLRVWWRIGILFFPSLTFWSAGLLKDPLGIFGLGLAFWATRRFLQDFRPSQLLPVAFGAYILLLFRTQVVPVLFIALIPWLLGKSAIRDEGVPTPRFSRYFRLALVPVCIIGLLLVGQISSRFSLSELPTTILGVNSLYDEASEVDFSIGLSTMNTSWTGLLSVAPYAIVASLFRPFVWETSSAPELAAAVENLILLGLTIRAIYHLVRYPTLFQRVWHSPMFVTCLIFVLLFALGVGASTPNLGTLSRYRTPLLPCFVGIITILQYHYLKVRPARLF